MGVGPILDGGHAVELVMAQLKARLPWYVAEVAELNGLARDFYAPPAQWETTSRSSRSRSFKYPAILVMSTGADGEAVKEGDGKYRQPFIVGVAALVSARDQEATNQMARRYSGAIKACILQRPSLGSTYVHGLSLKAEDYDDDLPPGEDDKTLASCRLIFTVELRGVVDTRLAPGPYNPFPDNPNQSYPDPPTVGTAQDIYVDVTRSDP